VVALSIPIVLAMTFLPDELLQHRPAQDLAGRADLALGLLVDDAIIAVEMMAVKMEQGWDRIKAAAFAWTNRPHSRC
jgi:multidrug efflux pump